MEQTEHNMSSSQLLCNLSTVTVDPAESSRSVYAFFERMSGGNSITKAHDPLPSPTRRSRIIRLKVPRHFLMIRDGVSENPNRFVSTFSAPQIKRNSIAIEEAMPQHPAPERITIRIKFPKPCETNIRDVNRTTSPSTALSQGRGNRKRKATSIRKSSKSNPGKTNVARPIFPIALSSLQPPCSHSPEKPDRLLLPPKGSTTLEAEQLGYNYITPRRSPHPALERIVNGSPILESIVNISMETSEGFIGISTCHDSITRPSPSIEEAETVTVNLNDVAEGDGQVSHTICASFTEGTVVEGGVENFICPTSAIRSQSSETAISTIGDHLTISDHISHELLQCTLPVVQISSEITSSLDPAPPINLTPQQCPSTTVHDSVGNELEGIPPFISTVDSVDSIALLYSLNRTLALLRRKHDFYRRSRRSRNDLDDSISFRIRL